MTCLHPSSSLNTYFFTFLSLNIYSDMWPINLLPYTVKSDPIKTPRSVYLTQEPPTFTPCPVFLSSCFLPFSDIRTPKQSNTLLRTIPSVSFVQVFEKWVLFLFLGHTSEEVSQVFCGKCAAVVSPFSGRDVVCSFVFVACVISVEKSCSSFLSVSA